MLDRLFDRCDSSLASICASVMSCSVGPPPLPPPPPPPPPPPSPPIAAECVDVADANAAMAAAAAAAAAGSISRLVTVDAADVDVVIGCGGADADDPAAASDTICS